ncbi:MAG: hypothetical protein K2X01_04030 [Cyanobacteria bacterium]|nr:hypothetical protein [Cyanobacteriota bacterium]
MPRISALSLLASLCYFASFLVISTIWNPALADPELPQDVVVKLYQGYLPFDQMQLEGPFFITEPSRQKIDRGVYTLQTKYRKLLELQGQSRRGVPVLIRSPRLVLQASLNTSNNETDSLSGGAFLIKPDTLPARRYGGSIEITLSESGYFILKNRVSAQEYVASIVGSESRENWGAEALKAQAVLTQSRLYRFEPAPDHKRPIEELSDDMREEVYLGRGYIRTKVLDAVKAVWGEAITADNQIFVANYHAICAGGTSGIGFFTGEPNPPNTTPPSKKPDLLSEPFAKPAYLHPAFRGVKCSFCQNSPYWNPHSSTFSLSEWTAKTGIEPPKISITDQRKRPLTVDFTDGHSDSGFATWLFLGEKLGYENVLGSRFKLTLNADKDTVTLENSGAGHGVGMCQWGASVLAAQGKTYREILAFYFPKSKIIKLTPSRPKTRAKKP